MLTTKHQCNRRMIHCSTTGTIWRFCTSGAIQARQQRTRGRDLRDEQTQPGDQKLRSVCRRTITTSRTVAVEMNNKGYFSRSQNTEPKPQPFFTGDNQWRPQDN